MEQDVLPEITTTKAVATVEKIDNGKPALYNPAAFDQIWRAARLFASSDLVPKDYKDKPENCFIAIEMADRLGINPFAVLQSLVIIQGKPSMEAKLITALVNDSGMFVDPLEYEVVGDDPFAMDYKVRCFATMKRTGKVCHGPWIDYKMVKGEGWLDKGGSKWKTMPSIMFMYRAASFFAKVYCSNITMGMQTREEMEDIAQPVDVTPVRPQNLASDRQQVTHIQTQQQPADEKPLFEGAMEQEQGHAQQPATRERGKASPGRQRRTKEELEEDRLADLEDQQRAEAAQQAALNADQAAPLDACPCEHPVSRFDGEEEYCEACGEKLSGPEPEPAAQVQQTVAAPAAQPEAGKVVDLF